MNLIVLHGAPGVGKLTVGRGLQALTGYRLFHNHLAFELGLALFPPQSMAFRELRERVWLDALGTAAKERVDVIFTLVFEPTLLASFYERLVSVVETNSGTVHAFELQCSPEENARRVVQPDRLAFSKETNPQFRLSAREAGAYDPPDIPGNIVIDTTSLTADETAQRIFEALKVPMR
jgi:broad-specificity NMP kinase